MCSAGASWVSKHRNIFADPNTTVSFRSNMRRNCFSAVTPNTLRRCGCPGIYCLLRWGLDMSASAETTASPDSTDAHMLYARTALTDSNHLDQQQAETQRLSKRWKKDDFRTPLFVWSTIRKSTHTEYFTKSYLSLRPRISTGVASTSPQRSLHPHFHSCFRQRP